jgi:hypothetical protein
MGSFLTVYSGYVEDIRPRIVVVDRDGRSHTVAFASSGAFETADPSDGTIWQVSGGADTDTPGAYPDQECAQVSQELNRVNPGQALDTPMTPVICGRLGQEPLFVSIRRFAPGDGGATGTPWLNSPARTLIYGAAAPRVRSVTLIGAGRPRPVPIDRSDGAFLVVLDGHVDPRSLKLIAHLRDGRTLTYRHSTALLDESGSTIPPRPDEPYRSPSPQRPSGQRLEDPVMSTVRMTLRASDPAGGPQWALRSWLGHVDPHAARGVLARTFTCWQIGVLHAGQLVEPLPGGRFTPLPNGDHSGPAGLGTSCNLPTPVVITLTDNPSAYALQPLRTVISGFIPRADSHPVLLGAGPPRPLPLDANHAYLLVVPGRYWRASLRVSIRTPDGRTIVRAGTNTFGPPISRPDVKAPDPDGSAPWGFAIGIPGIWGGTYRITGRVIDGVIGYGDPLTGEILPHGSRYSFGTPAQYKQGRNQGPVQLDATSDPEVSLDGSYTLSEAEIERRTLPGRTVITGVADPDVVSVTLTTPQDVRTIQPTGPKHVFIVVYDGVFYSGSVSAAALLTNGRTITESIPGAVANPSAGAPSFSLTDRIRSDQRALKLMRTRAGTTPQLGGAVSRLQLVLAVEERRLDYDRAHLGFLPPN